MVGISFEVTPLSLQLLEKICNGVTARLLVYLKKCNQCYSLLLNFLCSSFNYVF